MWFGRRRFFKVFLLWLPWQPEFFMEHKYLKEFERGPFNPFPNDKFWTPSKLKEFADDNFKFDENGIKFFNRLENTVRKGEIARNEQFLLFSQCFQKTCTADT